MKPKGGASLVTPTMTLPRARTSSSLDLPAAAAVDAACWAAGWLSLGEDQAGTRGNTGYVSDEFAP